MGVAYSVGEVDHLYTFFVQWSPEDIYSSKPHKHKQKVLRVRLPCTPHRDHQFVGVKRRPSTCSSTDSESEDLLPVLLDHSLILEPQHLQELNFHIPGRAQASSWKLLYSTEQHGTSLKTLYRCSGQTDRPVLMVIKDSEQQVFGAFSSDPFKVSRSCYGTGETFLYSFSPSFQVFPWSGQNSYFIRGFLDSLQMGGGGGHFGLWLDADLHHGSSFPCRTFCNSPLSLRHDFTIQELEVWTFI